MLHMAISRGWPGMAHAVQWEVFNWTPHAVPIGIHYCHSWYRHYPVFRMSLASEKSASEQGFSGRPCSGGRCC